VKQNKDWTGAAEYCQSQNNGASLVIIANEVEQVQLTAYLMSLNGQMLCSSKDAHLFIFRITLSKINRFYLVFGTFNPRKI